MTTIPINETSMFIEDALPCVACAERMIRLADQHRREGNHVAANGAVMMAWIIRENTAEAMEVLPNMTPEHAALLGQSERQRLAAELNSCYENLNPLGRGQGSDASQWDESDEQTAEWYMSCFEVGLAAHLANTIAVRTESLPHSETKIEVARLAVGKCCRAAHESMEYARKDNRPRPPHSPRPACRRWKGRSGTTSNWGDWISSSGRRWMQPREESDNFLGRCDLCGNVVRADDVSTHARSCAMAAVQGRLADKNPQ